MRATADAMAAIFVRYAVYVAPKPGPLADFGARWLGWDAAAGTARGHPEMSGLPAPVEAITRRPRKYGFHATLKPPFRLAAGTSRAALETDLAALAERTQAVEVAGLRLAPVRGFLALVAEGDTAAIDAVAAEVVRDLDHHRAPAPPEELARRREAGLTAAQEANLQRWGFPHVMDCFRFHLTLTGTLAPDAIASVTEALAPALAPILPRPLRIDELSLFGEDEDGRFHILERYPLSG